jgi:hypothetical protein
MEESSVETSPKQELPLDAEGLAQDPLTIVENKVDRDFAPGPGPNRPRRVKRRLSPLATLALLLISCQAVGPPETKSILVVPTKTVARVEEKRAPIQLGSLIPDITRESFGRATEFGISRSSDKEIANKLNIDLPLTIDKLIDVAVPENEEDQRAALEKIVELHYGGHGEDVARAMRQVDKLSGVHRPEPHVESLHAGMLKNFEIERDEIGNPTFWFELDSEELAKVIARSSEKFVNLSLELGKVGIKFKVFRTERANPDAIDPMEVVQLRTELVKMEDGSYTTGGVYQLPDRTQIGQEEYDKLWEKYSETKIVPRERISFTPIDAYGEGGNPLHSLTELANLASKFPDKIFFAAAGNPTKIDPQPNILGAKEELAKQGRWPANLIMIGYWGIEYRGEKYPSGYGADYYIKVDDLEQLGLSQGTSFATPVAQRLIANYFSKIGIEPTPSQVKELLGQYSQTEEIGMVWDEVTKKHFEDQVLRVIDLDRMAEDFKEGK